VTENEPTVNGAEQDVWGPSRVVRRVTRVASRGMHRSKRCQPTGAQAVKPGTGTVHLSRQAASGIAETGAEASRQEADT